VKDYRWAVGAGDRDDGAGDAARVGFEYVELALKDMLPLPDAKFAQAHRLGLRMVVYGNLLTRGQKLPCPRQRREPGRGQGRRAIHAARGDQNAKGRDVYPRTPNGGFSIHGAPTDFSVYAPRAIEMLRGLLSD